MASKQQVEQTLEQIEAEITKHNAAIDEHKHTLRALNKQRDSMLLHMAAAKQVADMTPEQRAAMKVELAAG
jgi:septal ring factor EnvC (AmiA/AmiB activator)